MTKYLDQRDKKKQIQALKREVDDFHPLLDSLFKRLPNTKLVEYTHGPAEKGADFILHCNDTVFNTIEYIGVIVKIGKITKSLTGIYEQIEECDIARWAENGKKKIRLSEIWVVTNDTISNNAMEKIHEKYRSRKIKFLQNQNIVSLIDKYMDHFWSCEILPANEYLIDLKKQLEQITIAQSLLPQGSQKIDLQLKLSAIQTNYRKNNGKSKIYRLLELLENKSIVIIEAGPGSGKSHLIRQTIDILAEPVNYKKYNIIPIYISYTDFYKNFDSSIEKILSQQTIIDLKKKLPPETQFTLFIDSFDELILKERDVYKEVKEILRETSETKNLKLVLATRPLNIVNFRELLPKNDPAYEIQSLSITQVINFFKEICKRTSISDRLFEDLKKSDLFKQMPRNPISAILLAQIVNDNAQDLPSNLTSVYSKYSELMLGRWDVDKGLLSNQAFEASESIIIRIARYFVEYGLTFLSEMDTKEFFYKYLEKRNFDLDPEDLFQRVTSRSGIIHLDHNNRRVYFKHRSFVEFFYAKSLYLIGDKELFDNKVYSLEWKTICFFYLGLLKDCSDLINTIKAIEPQNTNERFWRFANLAEYMLAAYATPYETIEETFTIAFKEISQLYMEIAENKVESPLNEMPEIFVLEFFQAIACGQYGYRFFEKAMDTAVLEIGTDEDLEDQKYYSLFFLSGLYRSLERENPFDGLIEKHEKKLPLPLKLGLYYESKLVRHHSSILKKNLKKLKKNIQKSPQLSKYVEKLHDLPINKKN